MRTKLVKIAAWVSLLVGLLTILTGGGVIADLFGMREKEGHYVLFVVWANFICGFLYLLASYGFFKRKNWVSTVLSFSVWILIAAFIGLIVWILNKEPYETKTIVALSFRILITLGLLWVARPFKKALIIDPVL